VASAFLAFLAGPQAGWRSRIGRDEPLLPGGVPFMTTTSDAQAGAARGVAPSPVGPPVPFDGELAPFLAAMPPFGFGEVTIEMIPAMRQARAGVFPPVTDDDLRRGGTYDVATRDVPGPSGAPGISLLICRPAGATSAVPALYHIHGGGMIMGTNRIGVLAMLGLAAPLGMAVVSVEYRLAPETPHPGPVEDCYAGLAWTAAHAAELGIDPGRIIVGGASAGGGLSAAVALLARDRGGPALAGQLLQCPMLDDRNDSVSALQMAGRGIWDRAANNLGWTALLGEARGGPGVSPYAAPARATDLSGLPPAYIDVGSAETFRDEDVSYATRIWQAGGVAELHVWPGGFHGFAGMVPGAAVSEAAIAAPGAWLGRLLASLG
jgi:acetyl esterase/lipase